MAPLHAQHRVLPSRNALARWLRYAVLSLLFSSFSWAADYRSIREAAPARLSPDESATPLFYYGAGTPVELIQELNGWAQVRDKEGGGLFWLPAQNLSSNRTVITLHDETEVRSAPNPNSALLVILPANAILSVRDTSLPGWVEVVTAKGNGFVAKRDVWGW